MVPWALLYPPLPIVVCVLLLRRPYPKEASGAGNRHCLRKIKRESLLSHAAAGLTASHESDPNSRIAAAFFLFPPKVVCSGEKEEEKRIKRKLRNLIQPLLHFLSTLRSSLSRDFVNVRWPHSLKAYLIPYPPSLPSAKRFAWIIFHPNLIVPKFLGLFPLSVR